VLPGGKGFPGVFEVGVMRAGNVYRVDIFVGQQGFEIRVCSLDAMFSGELPGPVSAAGADRQGGSPAVGGKSLGHVLCDFPG
jgi:hypothetical protein